MATGNSTEVRYMLRYTSDFELHIEKADSMVCSECHRHCGSRFWWTSRRRDDRFPRSAKFSFGMYCISSDSSHIYEICLCRQWYVFRVPQLRV